MTVFQAVAFPLTAVYASVCLWRLARRQGRTSVLALKCVVAMLASAAILSPDTTNRIARAVGIGRGADLMIYLLALAGAASFVYFYNRLAGLDTKLTELVRYLALRDAEAAARSDMNASTQPKGLP